jgi:hypothetical protein
MTNEEITRRAIHATFGHLPDATLAKLLDGAKLATHAGAAQVKAAGKMDELVREAVADLSPHYCQQIARYITGRAAA